MTVKQLKNERTIAELHVALNGILNFYEELRRQGKSPEEAKLFVRRSYDDYDQWVYKKGEFKDNKPKVKK